MSDDTSNGLEKIGFLKKYSGVKQLVDNEVTPLIDIWNKLSAIANNFATAADHVAKINVTKTHEIKELLEQAYEARKLAEKIEDVIEDRTKIAVRVIDTGFYDVKNIVGDIKNIAGGEVDKKNNKDVDKGTTKPEG
jgi:hypothetical protein